MMKKKKVLFTSAVWSLVASTFLCAEDIFDQESGTLHIPRVVANDGLPDSNTSIGYDVIVTIKSVEEVGDKYPVDLEQYPGMRNINPTFTILNRIRSMLLKSKLVSIIMMMLP